MNISIAFLPGPAALSRRGRLPADIIVLPELVDGGYAALQEGRASHVADDAYLKTIRDATAKNNAVVVAGSVRLRERGTKFTNTSLTYQHDRCVHRYDKIHLFHPTGDHRYFVPGRKADVFRARVAGQRLRIGVIICFDLRFPELIRSLAFRGMDLLIVPARWPAQRAEAWKTLLRARAIENQVFVAGCNAAGQEGGPSFVFGPNGAPVTAIVRGEGAGAKTYSLDFTEIAKAKRLYDSIKEARWRRR